MIAPPTPKEVGQITPTTLILALPGFLGLPTVLRTNGFVPTLAFIADGGLPVVCRRGHGTHGEGTAHMAPRRRQPSVLVRLRYVGLEGGLYALALCPFGHITNAGLAANYVRLCATVFSFTINAHKQASCELVRIRILLTIVALASHVERKYRACC